MTAPLDDGYVAAEIAHMEELFAIFVRGEWQQHAACAGMTDAMFPGKGSPTLANRALAACAACSVRAECLQASASALDTWRNGVWGGLTAGDRKANYDRHLAAEGYYGDPGVPVVIDRARGPIPHGTVRGYRLERDRGLATCQPCRDALARERRERYAARLEQAA